MKKTEQGLEDQLLDLLDGTLSESSREELMKKIATDEALRKQYESFKRMHENMSTMAIPDLSKNFTARVMQRLDEFPRTSRPSILNGLLMLGGILIAVVSVALLMSKGVFNQEAPLDFQSIKLTEKYVPTEIPNISVDGNIIVNSVMVLALCIAFAVLDRAVFRPLFRGRLSVNG